MTGLELAGTVIGIVISLLVLIGIVAIAITRYRTTSDETTAALWKEEAEAYKAKSERLEVAFANLERRVEHLEAENQMLRALHDNREEMRALRVALVEGFTDLKITIKEVR